MMNVRELKMEEKQNLIKKIQNYLKENKKDGLLIYDIDDLEPYFYEITGVPCSADALLYIPAEEKPTCIVSNLEIGAIRSTELFEKENITEWKEPGSFKLAVEKILKDLKEKKLLANFSEENPLVDQLPHSFFEEYLQNLDITSSENLWKSIGLEVKGKEYLLTTRLEIKKARVKEFKTKLRSNYGFLMVNGTGEAASQTYACYFLGFLKNHKYAIAIKPEKAIAIVHEDEVLKEHPFDEILTYKNIEEFQKIISEHFKDTKGVHYDDEMTEGNYRLVKKILEDKLKDSHPKNLVKELLAIKLPGEVKEIEKACKLNDEIFDYLEKELKAGMSEKEISKLIENKALSYPEVLKLFFPSLVAAGKNSAHIHHLASDYKVQNGDLLLVDIGLRLKTGMGSDTTCMYYFGSSIPERVKKYDEVMDRAINSAVEKVGPGRPKIDADLATRAVITKHYPEFEHGTGHDLGVKTHGSGEGITIAPRGLGFFGIGGIFSIEPGIYIKGKEGFRKEILIYVTKDGVKKLSEIPKLRLIRC